MHIPEMTRRERKKDETRRRIFEAALALFREKGIDATTVDEITEKADVARGTFFNYFPRKEAVFAFMAEEHVAAVRELLPPMLASDAPTLEILTRAMQLAADRYMRDREVSRLVFAEWIKQDVQPAVDADASARQFMRALVTRGHARGEVRTDVDETRASALFKGVFLATLFQWLYCEEGCPEAIADLHGELAERLRFAFEGVAPRKAVRA